MADTMLPDPSASHETWMRLSGDVCNFLRENRCIEALDFGLYLFKGNAESQLAAFLRERLSPTEDPSDLPHD